MVATPSWVTERPINQAYYIGIASVSKSEYPYNATDIARDNALNSLAREIRVQVNSESVLSTLQVNHWVEESFASNITSTVAEDLEGYTLVGSFEDENEVHVYYKIASGFGSALVITIVEAQGPEGKRTAKLEIEGMMCEVGCAAKVKKELLELDGVASVIIDFDSDRESDFAIVEYDENTIEPVALASTVNGIADGRLYGVPSIEVTNYSPEPE